MRSSLALILALCLAGCGLLPAQNDDETRGWSANKLYSEAKSNLNEGNYEKAIKSLSKLRRLPQDHPGLVEELAEIRANHEFETTMGKGSYADLLKGTMAKRLLTGCLLQALQQLSGVS